MKRVAFFLGIAVVVTLGAGCSKATKIAGDPVQVKQALIQRRTTEPPKSPENVPAPTPVNSIEVIK